MVNYKLPELYGCLKVVSRSLSQCKDFSFGVNAVDIIFI